MNSRRGFALLAVLWIITGLAVISMGVALAARERVRTAFNRSALLQAEWNADDCVARATAALDGLLLRSAGPLGTIGAAPSDSLPLLVSRAANVRACPGVVRIEPVGMTIDLATAPTAMLRRAIELQGFSNPQADDLVDALLDWRDPDDTPRTHGCETRCTTELGLDSPRNAAILDVAELRLVRGFDSWDSLRGGRRAPVPLEQLFTTEPGRVAITWAPFEVLAALPGIGVAGARDLVAYRRSRSPINGDLAGVREALGPIARDSFALAFDALSRLATTVPDAWLIVVTSPRPRADDSIPPLGIRLVTRVQFTSSGVRVQRRRMVP